MSQARVGRVLTVLAAAMLLGTLVPPSAVVAQDDDGFSVLVYSRTEGFRHASIPSGIAAIQRMGEEHGFGVEATEDPAAFTDDNLARFAAVVFLNTTGDILPAAGEDAFERYLRAGGGYVGVHSAADTEYEWDFYGEILAGAWFRNHPIQQPGVVVKEEPDHPSTAHLPGRWQIPFEEYYSFQRNPRPDVRVLLTIDEDSYEQDPNTSNLPDNPDWMEGETGTMGDHPMSWCHEIDLGHVWYTALGHENYLYEVPDYREHLLGGILTAAGRLEADCAATAGGPATPEPAPDDGEEAGDAAGGEGAGEDDADASDALAALPATGNTAAVTTAVGLLLLGLVLRLRAPSLTWSRRSPRGGARRPDRR